MASSSVVILAAVYLGVCVLCSSALCRHTQDIFFRGVDGDFSTINQRLITDALSSHRCLLKKKKKCFELYIMCILWHLKRNILKILTRMLFPYLPQNG